MSDILQQIINENLYSKFEETGKYDPSKPTPDVVGEVKKIPGIDIMPTGIDNYVLPYLFKFFIGLDRISGEFIDFLLLLTNL